MTLGLALLRALKNHGAQEIFGIPGDFILPLFKQIEESNILPLVTLSHEPALGFAADAAARMHCGLGVVAVTYGAGALNVVNAVASAYAERSPLVILAGCPGEVEAHSGLVLHHQVRHIDSQWRIFSEITCDQVRLSNPETAPQDIARVLRNCLELSQPVLIEVPRDMTLHPMAEVPVLPPSAFSADAVAECADEWMARIQAAKRPVLVVDVEVRRFGIEARVAELARRLQLPVLTTFMGRGLLADDGVNSGVQLHGTYLGVAGAPETSALLDESDLPVMLGAILSDNNFGVSAQRMDFRRALIAAHREARVGHHLYQNIPLAALVEALLERAPAAGQRAAHAAPPKLEYPTGLVADDAPVCAADLSRALNDRILAHGPMNIVSDIGDCLFAAMELMPTPLVMTGWELGNCPRLGLDPIVIVLNNQTWEMIRAFQTESRCAALGDWHLADAADALGGRGHRVHTRAQFKAALDAAYAERGRFQLIELMVPPGDSTPTLRRFSEGIRALRARAAAAAA
jgi:indolepyruvate decarboxylase